MYGGYTGSWPGDLWQLTFAGTPTWTQLTPDGLTPPARQDAASFYDPVGQRMVVFGGASRPSSFMNDVWALSLDSPGHETWSQLNPSGPLPSARDLMGYAYDSSRQQLVSLGPAMQWTQLIVDGVPPSPRWIYGMRYDPPRDRFLFFGGLTELDRPNDTWALNLAGSPSWTELTPAGTPPSGRSDHSMVYDSANDRMVVFGGYDGAMRNDAWALDLAGGGSWVQLTPLGAPPEGRDIIDAIYDPARSRMVVYGGWSGSSFLNDTWALSWAALAAHSRIEVPMPASAPRPEPRVTGSGEVAASAVSRNEVPAHYALELAGAWPNPAVRELWVGLTLPRDDPARLELLDLSGRLVAARDVGDLGPGRHRVHLGDGARLAPGMYVIRLSTGGRAITRKTLIVR